MKKRKVDKKIVLQALIGSAAIHAIYVGATSAVGYAKTVLYQPNMVQAWENAEMLQQEVAFNATFSPFFFGSTFVGLTLICAILLLIYKKMTTGLIHQEVD